MLTMYSTLKKGMFFFSKSTSYAVKNLVKLLNGVSYMKNSVKLGKNGLTAWWLASNRKKIGANHLHGSDPSHRSPPLIELGWKCLEFVSDFTFFFLSNYFSPLLNRGLSFQSCSRGTRPFSFLFLSFFPFLFPFLLASFYWRVIASSLLRRWDRTCRFYWSVSFSGGHFVLFSRVSFILIVNVSFFFIVMSYLVVPHFFNETFPELGITKLNSWVFFFFFYFKNTTMIRESSTRRAWQGRTSFFFSFYFSSNFLFSLHRSKPVVLPIQGRGD